MDLEHAEQFGKEIVSTLITRHVEKAEIAGSVRRRCPQVNDLDIVVIPKDWMWASIPTALKHLSLEFVRGKTELFTFIRKEDNFTVDVYHATPLTWGTLLLIRTGSKMHNVRMCMRARELGMMLSAKSGVLQNGVAIASRTEEDIFKVLQLDFIPPERREV